MMSSLIPADLAAPKNLGDRRRLFTFCLHLLIAEAYRRGTPIALDTVKTGVTGDGHMAAGTHPLGLGADCLEYVDTDHDGDRDDYVTDTAKYAALGSFWKSLHPDCRWGGDFHDSKGAPKPDGNHFSLTMDGKA